MDELIKKEYTLSLDEVTKKLGINGEITEIHTIRRHDDVTGEYLIAKTVNIKVTQKTPIL